MPTKKEAIISSSTADDELKNFEPDLKLESDKNKNKKIVANLIRTELKEERNLRENFWIVSPFVNRIKINSGTLIKNCGRFLCHLYARAEATIRRTIVRVFVLSLISVESNKQSRDKGHISFLLPF